MKCRGQNANLFAILPGRSIFDEAKDTHELMAKANLFAFCRGGAGCGVDLSGPSGPGGPELRRAKARCSRPQVRSCGPFASSGPNREIDH